MESKRTYMFVDGNTVRKAEAEPDHQRKQQQREERRRKNQKAARRNQERELRMNRGHLVFLSIAVGITCLVSAAYIHLQSNITTRMNNISALESEISNLKTDNDTTLKRINTSIDMSQIKEQAMGELGMVYATQEQIAYYSINDTDYMTQYSDIPGK